MNTFPLVPLAVLLALLVFMGVVVRRVPPDQIPAALTALALVLGAVAGVLAYFVASGSV